ncbi:MAG: DUF4097 domain-containing protein [Candidatus Eisenbacteria bacterium]|uniref:DUF4097 domain-containing protein n=1 Tax=Eiseniibacteriota bacterium TaxID=2212470 RepID=A0A538UCZ9_UNCEI|nr:MAG: DUF4097 domain-containing protein [Candidatus Eisenbacteria bacterium]
MVTLVALVAYATLALLTLTPGPALVASSSPAMLAASDSRGTYKDDDDWAERALERPDLDKGWVQSCDDHWDDGRDSYCMVRELPYQAAWKPIAIDGGQNGGMTVTGWDRPTVRILYRVKARAHGADRAKALAEAIHVDYTGGKIRSTGPPTSSAEWWSTEIRAWVPRSSDLWLHTINGPLGVESVRGTMDINSLNGPVSLVDLAGAVEARVQNGPLHVELRGSRWDGAGLDAQAQNGPVNFVVPEKYSARLTTGTIHGPQTIHYALDWDSGPHRHIATTLGSGGRPVRVVTYNGPFRMVAR